MTWVYWTLEKTLFTRYQKNTVMFDWSPSKGGIGSSDTPLEFRTLNHIKTLGFHTYVLLQNIHPCTVHKTDCAIICIPSLFLHELQVCTRNCRNAFAATGIVFLTLELTICALLISFWGKILNLQAGMRIQF